MMANETAATARYAELMKLQLLGRRFLDREEERRLLEEGLTRYGLSLDQANGLLRASAEEHGTALEAELGKSTRELLKTMADRRGRVSRQDFGRTVAFYRARAGGDLPEAEAQKRVKRLMEEMGLQARPNGRVVRSRRWYRAIES